MKIELLDESILPNGFSYPNAIIKAIELNLVNFDIWYFFEKEQMVSRYLGLKKRYPNRQLIPFARRDDSDDIACFEVGKGEHVQIIHDFASEGWVQKGNKTFNNFWEWLRSAINEMIEHEIDEVN